MNPTPEESALQLLDVVPAVMRDIRTRMRSGRSPDLTVPQFRTLGFLDRHRGSSLSDVASHMGLTLPSASRLVDGLIGRGLISREEQPVDRRRLRLGMTHRGLAVLRASRAATVAYLTDILGEVDGDERKTIVRAMEVLREAFRGATRAKLAAK